MTEPYPEGHALRHRYLERPEVKAQKSHGESHWREQVERALGPIPDRATVKPPPRFDARAKLTRVRWRFGRPDRNDDTVQAQP